MTNTILRKLRGMFGMGLTWGVGWGIVIFILGSILGIFDPDSIDAGEEPWRLGLLVGSVGFVSGSLFGLIFSRAERRKSIKDLSVLRATFWGALGGAALPLLTSMNDATLFNTVPLGAAFAAATVAIARRSALREPLAVEELAAGVESPKLQA